mgnify:CR=1 FL=1
MAELWMSMDIDDELATNQLAYYQTLLKQKTHGDWEDPEDFHITLDYIGEDESGADKVVEAMHLFEKEIDSSMYNQYIFGNKVNRFDGGAMWVGVDNSFRLYQIHYGLEEKLKQVGYQKPKSKFVGYTPHITMAYNTPKIDFTFKMNKVAIPLSNITLWNSFKVNGQYVDNFLYRIDLNK